MKRSYGIVLGYVNTALTVVGSLILASFLLKTLGDTEYGLYQSTASFVAYLVLFEFGIGTVLTRNLSIARHAPGEGDVERIVSTVCVIALFFALLILGVSVLFYKNFALVFAKTMSGEQILYAKRIFLLLTAHLLAVFFTQVLDGFLLGMEQYTFARLRAVLQLIAKLALTLSILWFRRYAILIAAIDLGLSFCALLVTALYCRKKYAFRVRFGSFDRAVLRASFPLCMALFLQSVINQANSNVDKFVIGVMMSMEDVALYSITQYFYTMFASLMTTPVALYLPEVAGMLADRPDGERLTERLIGACRLEALIGAIILGGIFAVGRPFVALFFGAAKTSAWGYALVILVPMFVNMTTAVTINVLDVLNKRLARSLILFFAALVNIVLTVLLIGRYKILGAVIGTAISLILGNILIMNLYYRRRIGIRVLTLYREAYRGVLAPCAIAAAVGFLISFRISSSLFSLLVGGFAYLGLALALLNRFGLREEEKAMLRTAWDKLKKRNENAL